MKKCSPVLNALYFVFLSTVICLCANCVVPIIRMRIFWLLPILPILFLLANAAPSLLRRHFPTMLLRICYHGAYCLKLFLFSSVISAVYHIIIAFSLFPSRWYIWVISALVCILTLSLLFWNGIICVYLTSVQLGLRHRVVGLLCGMIPIANLFALFGIIRVVSAEVDFECNKTKLNLSRKNQQICRTKYPLLLVHGVFFRDYKYVNYWGRIPDELQKNGAVIYYGNHQSAASISDSGMELAQRIRQIVTDTGCEKVNIIAHSKGGLDSRYALSCCGISQYVASLTTINTPHLGCEFADYLLNKIPIPAQKQIENAYNFTMKRLGDQNPDFMSAVRDLTSSRCFELDREMKTPDNVYCQSVGSKLNKATNGKFPLNFTYHLVKYFDGANDGLVSENSLRWGNNFTFLTVNGKRGISHGDMVDLNRENIPGFDVREYYVQLVNSLRKMGF